MTYQQQQAIKIIESDVLFEAQSSHGAEYIECECEKFKRNLNGDIEAIESGKYEILLTPDEDGTLHVELKTDYGFCSATSYYGEISKDGTITAE